MARTASARTATPAPAAPEKEPGRLRQLWLVFQMTRRFDPTVVWWLLLGLITPIAVAVVVSVVVLRDNVIGIILTSITGLFAGVLLALLVLSRKAERAAFAQVEGQPGAVGAVLKNSLRRSWIASEMPVAISPKTQDAVYRAVGKGGVVLIGEGPISRTRIMLVKERANVQRVLPNVPVTVLTVGPDAESLPLHRINRTLGKLKKALTRAEITEVANRLSSLQRSPIGLPKGVDPFKMRMSRPR